MSTMFESFNAVSFHVNCKCIIRSARLVHLLACYVVGKLITAAYVPVPNYHSLFPDSAQATTLVLPSSARVQTAT